MGLKNIKNIAFLIISILIIITIIVIFIINKEKYVNQNDTDINIINFNCSATPSVKLDDPPSDINCTSGDNPICLNHLLISSKPEYIL
jgi:hypothetical protein